MLELTGIEYHPATAQIPILRGIELTVQEGTPTIVAGASGSGKTSLLEIISGLTTPHRGKIYWNKSLINARQRRSLCGVVFQFPERHFLGLTIAQELRLGHRRLSGEDQAKALRKVGLLNIDTRKPPESLSGGQQRRLAVAVQLLKKPAVLLLDEPTAGLDWSVRDEVLELLMQIAKDQLIIIVTHEPELFTELRSTSYFLKNGVLSQESKLKEIK